MNLRELNIENIQRERKDLSSHEFRANLAVASGKLPPAKIEMSLSTFAIIKDALNLARLETIDDTEREAGFDYDDYEFALRELMRDNKLELAYMQVRAMTKVEELNKEEKSCTKPRLFLMLPFPLPFGIGLVSFYSLL